METVDYDLTDTAIDFIKRAKTADKPFFVWWNSTRMHIWTRLRPEADGKTGLGVYPDGMVEHDGHVGQLLKTLDDLGIANDTIVVYATDNGAEAMSWPDGGTTPFHGEKNTNWEGGYRVPMLMRWPGVIKPGTIVNDIGSHEDMLPTLYAAATGTTDIADKLKAGAAIGGQTFKVHLDGYDWGPYFRGQAAAGPRRDFIYWTDGGGIAGLRYDQWKMVFMEQRAEGFEVWAEPLVTTRLPKIINLRAGSVRAGAARGHRLQALLDRPRLPARAGAGVRREVADQLQGVPAAHEAGQLLAGPGDGADVRGGEELTASTRGRRRRLALGVLAWLAACRAARAGRGPSPVVERYGAEKGDRRLRRARHPRRVARLRPPAERIAVFDNDGTPLGGAADVLSARLRPRPGEGFGAPAPGMADAGAVQVAAGGRPEGRTGRRREVDRRDHDGHARGDDHR